MRRILGCFVFFMIIMASPIIAGNVYYVDAASGNDSNDGLSKSGAWKTISKVNSESLSPGDSILFKRGDIWRDGLRPSSSGSSGSPITFGSYGKGNKPIISGGNLVNDWTEEEPNKWKSPCNTGPDIVYFDGVPGNEKSSINDLNYQYDWYWGFNTLYVYSKSNPETAYTDSGVEWVKNGPLVINGKDYLTFDGIKFVAGDRYYIIKIYNGANNIIIQNCTLNNFKHGIVVGDNDPSSVATVTNIIIDNNTIESKQADLSVGDGIRFENEVQDSIISNNSFKNIYHSGVLFWSIGSIGDPTTNNIVERNTFEWDNNAYYGRAFNTEGEENMCTNNIFRYNMIKNQPTQSQILGNENYFYYNIWDGGQLEGKYSDHSNAVAFETYDNCVCHDNYFYNNIIHNAYEKGIVLCGYRGYKDVKNNVIKNNIIIGCDSSGNNIQIRYANTSETKDQVIQYNCLYSPATSDMIDYKGKTYDVSKAESNVTGWTNNVQHNPLFINVSNGNFKLQDISLCIDAGTDVSLRQDYEGNTVPAGSATDMGAYEHAGVIPSLTANINASSTSGYIPLTVDFTADASGGTSPYSFSWNFGDGSSSSEQNTSHTYSDAGTYTVTLTVTDSNSSQASDSLIITASAPALSATASASPISGEVPLTVSFTASVSGGTTPYSYSWNFGDDNSSSEQNPSHTYSDAGTYTITLTVTDSSNSQASGSITITASEPTNLTYNLTISATTYSSVPGEGGTIDPSPGDHPYSTGSSVTVKAAPNENYRFSKWTGDVSDSDSYNEEITIIIDKDKSISGYFFTKCGDVNGDLSITPADAQAAFDIYLGKISNPTESEKENADVNCSGTKTESNITPADAQAIFDKYLAKSELPCDCSCQSRTGSVSAQRMQGVNDLDINLIINNIELNQDKDIFVPIIADNAFNIKAFGLDLLFPPDIFEFVGVDRTDLQKDFIQVDANKIAEGVVRAGGYLSKPIMDSNPRVLITLIFRVIGEMKKPTPFVIINTVDDIKNASVKIKNGILTEKIKRSRDIFKEI